MKSTISMDSVEGYIERITFQNPENGYTIAQLQEGKKSDLTCLVGFMPSIKPGETVHCEGNWKHHLVHGRQFIVEKYQVRFPADVVGIEKYLGSGLIKGIGPVYAKRIVAQFGTETLSIIDQEPEKLLSIEGIGKSRLDKITKCWSEQKSIREVMIFLQSHGVSPSFAQKIFKTYGDASIEKVTSNPFSLSKDIFGIGFKTADAIASKLGIAKDAPKRIESGIEYVLSELSNEGHVCYPKEELLGQAEEILQVPESLIASSLQNCFEDGRVEIFDLSYAGQLKPFVWIKPLFMAEIGISKELHRLNIARSNLRKIDVEKALDWVQKELNIALAQNQKQAVAESMTQKVQIITGGPGTGKSTITKAILEITGKLTPHILLAAPTGRAAKRMSEITKKKAATIHSLLEYNFKAGGFKHNRENPLQCDLIIIDESSMIDTLLMYSLLKAIPDHARVIFVGDINQLPSVGPGNVLKDIIASQTVSVTMLNEIFRQAAGSHIITNAHRINNGHFPEIANKPDSDFFFIEAEEPEGVLQEILSLVTVRLPQKYRLNPVDEIQVLAPMRKGVIGLENLNNILQEALNPKDNPFFSSGRKFLVGDKVMQIRNNYQKEVFNGDIGRIEKIIPSEQQMLVRFDELLVPYDFNELDEIVLAYAVSIHKYQGSECPCVVMPVHTTHFKLLFRNLLYTGVTRGKKLVVLVGSKKALSIAVRNDEVRKRYTGLTQALMGMNHAVL